MNRAGIQDRPFARITHEGDPGIRPARLARTHLRGKNIAATADDDRVSGLGSFGGMIDGRPRLVGCPRPIVVSVESDKMRVLRSEKKLKFVSWRARDDPQKAQMKKAEHRK